MSNKIYVAILRHNAKIGLKTGCQDNGSSNRQTWWDNSLVPKRQYDIIWSCHIIKSIFQVQ